MNIRVPREAIIKKPRVLEIVGGAWLGDSASFSKVSEDLDADSNGDRSVGVASCDDMVLRAEARDSVGRIRK